MPRTRYRSQPPRILIVDDDHDAAWTLAELLHLSLQCEVRTASDGAEALEQASGMRPDVVIMDIRMPGVDGIEAVDVMRRLFAPDDLPLLIALTGLDSDADRLHILASGFEAYLVKPVSMERLLALLAAPVQPRR